MSNTSLPFSRARLRASKASPAGVGAHSAGDNLRARALAPDLELIDGGGAEGIAGRQRDFLALADHPMRQLADGRGLAGAVDADDQDHVRAVIALERQRLGDRGKRALHLGGQHGAHLLRRDLLVVAALRQGLGDAHGRLDAQVRLNQQVLELLQRISVELPLGEDAGDVFGQARRRLGQPGLEALEPALLLRRLRAASRCAAAGAGSGCGRSLLSRRRIGAGAGGRLRAAKEAQQAARFGGTCRSQRQLGGERLAAQPLAVGRGDAGPQQLSRLGRPRQLHLGEARRAPQVLAARSAARPRCRSGARDGGRARHRPSPAAAPPAP